MEVPVWALVALGLALGAVLTLAALAVALLLRARERLGQQVIIRIERVAEIPRTRNGKFRQIVSRLSGSEEVNV